MDRSLFDLLELSMWRSICNSAVFGIIVAMIILTYGVNTAAANKHGMGKHLDAYAKIAGGWFLETKCNTLSAGLKREYEWHTAKVTEVLVSVRKVPWEAI